MVAFLTLLFPLYLILHPSSLFFVGASRASPQVEGSRQQHRGLSHPSTRGSCVPSTPVDNLTSRLNTLLYSSGPAYILSLCPGETYPITSPLMFSAPSQEISTFGYPRGEERAMIIVSGDPAVHSVAINGKCADCTGVRLRNIQIDGSRLGRPPITGSGANIEMGGSNSNQLIEYVRSFDPRSWSCLHISEGERDCDGAVVQHNDIGPCGSDAFQEWADGISLSCRNSVVRGNSINTATDGAIVLFGSPGSLVENNTIWVETYTLLGGINMVDYAPFDGDYTGTIIQDNVIFGGFASRPLGNTGTNDFNAMVKIGLAIGPRTWFGSKFGTNSSRGGIVRNNIFSGGFGWAIAMSSASNFTVENNRLDGNTSFFGSRGPNCSSTAVLPTPAPFIFEQKSVEYSTIQMEFQTVPDAHALTCIRPPSGGSYWPVGDPVDASESTSPWLLPSVTHARAFEDPVRRVAGLAVGLAGGVAMVLFSSWILKRCTARRHPSRVTDKGKEGYIASYERVH